MPPDANKLVVAIMMHEVSVQCRHAIYAYEQFRKTVDEYDEEVSKSLKSFAERLRQIIEEGATTEASDEPPNADQERTERSARKRLLRENVYFYTHALLTHSTNISRLFWPDPNRKKYAARGEALRTLIGLDENSPLAQRSVRNAPEHYDERVENWASALQGKTVITDLSMVSPRWFTEWSGGKLEDMHRAFDPDTSLFSFLGAEQDLIELMREVGRVYAAADKWLIEYVPGMKRSPSRDLRIG